MGQIQRGPVSISVWVSQPQTFPLKFGRSKGVPHKCPFFSILAMKLPAKLKPDRHPSGWQVFPFGISKVRGGSHRSCPGPFDPDGANPTRPGSSFGLGVAVASVPLGIWKVQGGTPQVPFFFNFGNEITGKIQAGPAPFRVANFPLWNFKGWQGSPWVCFMRRPQQRPRRNRPNHLGFAVSGDFSAEQNWRLLSRVVVARAAPGCIAQTFAKADT
jgi:hypothetical protein